MVSRLKTYRVLTGEMRPALFDSSIYIAAVRRGNEAVVALRNISADAPLWMSSVVLEDLDAGADSREPAVVERMERDCERIKRRLTSSPKSQRLDRYRPCPPPIA